MQGNLAIRPDGHNALRAPAAVQADGGQAAKNRIDIASLISLNPTYRNLIPLYGISKNKKTS